MCLDKIDELARLKKVASEAFSVYDKACKAYNDADGAYRKAEENYFNDARKVLDEAIRKGK